GRFAAAVWGPFEENTWARVPLEIVPSRIPGPVRPSGPGPFGLSEAKRLTELLKDFKDVSITRLELRERTEPSLLLQSGPVAGALREAGQAPTRELETEVAQA